MPEAESSRASVGRIASLSWNTYRAVTLGPLIGTAAAGVLTGFVLAPDEASKEFYSTVAEVIPVLLLTLAVQARIFQLPTGRELLAAVASTSSRDSQDLLAYTEELAQSTRLLIERTVLGVGLLGLLVAAEFAALHPLATGKPDDGNPEIIYVALATGFLMLAGLAMLGRIDVRTPPPEPKPAATE